MRGSALFTRSQSVSNNRCNALSQGKAPNRALLARLAERTVPQFSDLHEPGCALLNIHFIEQVLAVKPSAGENSGKAAEDSLDTSTGWKMRAAQLRSGSQVTPDRPLIGYKQRLEFLGGLEEAHGVDSVAVATDFVMQMRAG
jgi:hypothetical protein